MERIYGTPNSPIGRNLLKERKRFPILTWVTGTCTCTTSVTQFVHLHMLCVYKTEMAGMEGICTRHKVIHLLDKSIKERKRLN